MGDDGNDNKDDGGLRSSFSHTSPLPVALQGHPSPDPQAFPLPTEPSCSCIVWKIKWRVWAGSSQQGFGPRRSADVGCGNGAGMTSLGSGNNFILVLVNFGRKQPWENKQNKNKAHIPRAKEITQDYTHEALALLMCW